MPRKYKLRVVSVEAIQVTTQSAERAARWCNGQVVTEIDPFDSSIKFAGVNVPTLDGVKRASSGQNGYVDGDFIVKNGSFKVMSAVEFNGKYELID